MAVNDPVGDLVTRLRNATLARHDKMTLPSSNLKVEVIKVLKEEGFVADFVVHEKKPQNEVTVMLKYGPNRERSIVGIKRVSKPGLRRYVSVRVTSRACGAAWASPFSPPRAA